MICYGDGSHVVLVEEVLPHANLFIAELGNVDLKAHDQVAVVAFVVQ